MGRNKLALWEGVKEQLGGCSCSCQYEPLEGPLGRICRPGAPRLGIQFNRRGVFPSEPRNFQRDPGSLDLPCRAKGRQRMCARSCTFTFVLETLLSSPGSGITALKKGTLRSTFPGAWDRKFAWCWEREPPSVRRDSKLRCTCQPLFEVRSTLIQQTSRFAERPNFQVRGLWKSCFPCNSSTDIAGSEQYCQWGKKQREFVWHDWVPSWAQLFKGAFLLEVGPKSNWGRTSPLFLPACQWVEPSWLYERQEKSIRVDVHALANLNHLKAHSRESVALRTLGPEYRFTDRVCSNQGPEVSRETLAH